MDSADAATPLGGWAWIRGYFTPATLFLVVNLVIGTIALTSRATQQRRRREHYYHDDGHGLQEPLHGQMEQPGYGHYYHPEQTLYAVPPPPAPLARTSSVLDRLRSFGLYRFRSGDFPPEFVGAAAAPNHAQDVYTPVEEEETTATAAQYARSRSEPAPAARREDERRPAPPRVKKSGSEVRKSQVARAVPRTVEAVAEHDDSVEETRAEESVGVGGRFRRGPSPVQREYHYQEEYVPPPARARARAPAAPAPLQRTSSVLDRLRSLGLYGFLAPDQPAAAASVPASDGFATQADEKRHAHANAHSRSEPAREQQGKKEKKPEAKSRMAKPSSEARNTPAPRPVEADGECVNLRAEAFIDSFRKQQQEVVVQHYQEEEYVPPPEPAPPLSRTSSVLDRLRSFGLYRFRSGDLGPDIPAAATETDEKEKLQAAHYGRSRSEPGKKKKQEARMSKSSSSGVVEEEAETEECVDARADDFINKFRQQLQLQRLNSLLNYKEMLNRGAGGKQ